MSSERPSPFFIGDHPAIDFLNTIAAPQGEEIDWLVNGEDLIAWLEQAKMIDPEDSRGIRAFDAAELAAVVDKARTFREWLRRLVTAHMGKSLHITPKKIGPINELLSMDNSFARIESGERRQKQLQPPRLRRVSRWESPAELLVPIAAAAADLICHRDFQLIRACEGAGCILIFLDSTKAHSRRWCSMAVCGNRAKVAAHRIKQSQKHKK